MNNKNIVISVVVVVLLFVAYYLGTKNNNSDIKSSNESVSVITDTEDTMLSTTTDKVLTKPSVVAPTTTYLKIGQRTSINRMYVTPTKVTYDSRCPKDVKCIQAGTVELGVLLESGSLSQNAIITLGKPFYFAERQVTLTSVIPGKVSTKTIKESEYRFTISVK